MKERVLTTLDALTTKIENRFNTKILRKMLVEKKSPLFQTIFPIENKLLAGRENNVFGPLFTKLFTFDNAGVYCAGILFVPTTDDDYIIQEKLEVSNVNVLDVLKYLSDEFEIPIYDGGFIKMSYAMTSSMERDGMYSSKDTLLSHDIYQKMGSVKYRRILFYF